MSKVPKDIESRVTALEEKVKTLQQLHANLAAACVRFGMFAEAIGQAAESCKKPEYRKKKK